ncbi:MAG TPA: glycerol kinase GlpK, partial [Gemmataceae bacterium]|nr:glycerol kinase GlpK [Gemmataceae bacterium]
MARKYILAIDQGTTSTRAVVYDESGHDRGSAARELTQHYPQPGWVEHDAEEIWQSVGDVVPRALAAAGVTAQEVAAIGLTNQRETTVIWDRASGRPIARAIVWQDRRTADFCRQHKGDEAWIIQRTGLVLDPYFSATKIRWLLDKDAQRRAAAEAGRLACGTIDSFLVWRLTGGKVHATDVTNASRTLLLNLKTTAWDDESCRFFAVPRALLPEVRPSAADYGVTAGLGFLPDGLPVAGVAGDQQAALFGQRCFTAGEAKCTYGTGAFFLQHLGGAPILSRHRLLCTVAATLDERPQYALEGSVFVAGAAVQWLRDGMKFFPAAADVEALAAQSDGKQEVLLIPGFVGMGAPHWAPDVRGAILGITRATTAADLARAALEGVAYQVADLVEAAGNDAGRPLHDVRVDGGMARNAWFLQCQADVLGMPVLQSTQSEATALGAAYLAGLRAGVWPNLDALRGLARDARRFEP